MPNMHKHTYTIHMYLYTFSHIHKTDKKHRTHTDSANGLILVSFCFTRLKVHFLIYKYTDLQCGCLQHPGSDTQFTQQLRPDPSLSSCWHMDIQAPGAMAPHQHVCADMHAHTHTRTHAHPQSIPIPHGVAGSFLT